jgi:hypothetical protein
VSQNAEFLSIEEAFFELVGTDLPGKIKSGRLREFLQYWRAIAGGDVPTRSDIDPTAIKPLLPYILLVDLTDEPLRVFYRLIGTEVARFSGRDFTGYWLDELEFDEFGDNELLTAYRRVRDSRLPGAGRAQYFEMQHLVIETEYLICPLRSPDGKIDKCIGIEDYFLGGALSIGDVPPMRLRTSRAGG